MKYRNFKNTEIDTDNLGDKELVLMYKFFFAYNKILDKIVKSSKDKEFHKYFESITDIKDSMYKEIKNRKLVMSKFF